VENVGYLEADSVDEDQIAADEDMAVSRIRRRQHHFQFARARLHFSAQARRERAIHNQLTLESGRQAVALGKARRQMRVVRAIPVMDIVVAILVMAMTVAMTVTFTVAVPAIAVFGPVVAAAVVIVIAIVFVMTVAVALSHSDGRGERQRHNCNGAGAEPEL
jgi:hypothetical protein